MTTEKMSFEESLKKEANKYWNDIPFTITGANTIRGHILNSYGCGAHWAREETIREVLGLLRSESADTACGMMELEFKDSGNQHVCSTDWADWLESKLKEPTIVMKDPMYRIPDDEL